MYLKINVERRINRAETDAALTALADYLRTQDLAKEKMSRRLNTLAVIAFNLLVIVVLLIAVLRWRGFI